MGIFSEYFVENVHMCKKLNKFHVEQGFCQYKDCLTNSLHTVSVLTKLFLLSILRLSNIAFVKANRADLDDMQFSVEYNVSPRCSCLLMSNLRNTWHKWMNYCANIIKI